VPSKTIVFSAACLELSARRRSSCVPKTLASLRPLRSPR